MEPPTINLGHRFARPFESRYNMLRRCLTSNPGLPLGVIESALRAMAPAHDSTLDRLEALQLGPLVPALAPDHPRQNRRERQCPQCALVLYHTEVYHFLWLSHCPIHHCALTPQCTVCRRPWPASHADLARRNCPACGRVPLERLGAALEPEECRVIGEIIDFATRDDPTHSLVGTGQHLPVELLAPWWREITIDSPEFASVQAYRKPVLTEAELDARHIMRPTIRRQASPLVRHKSELAKTSHGPCDPFDLQLTRRTRRYRRRQFRAWQSILSWIATESPRHRLHITSYRHRRAADFLHVPDPCPYCMALSLWFFHTSAQRFGPYYARHVDVYPFYQSHERGGFFDAFEPQVLCEDGALLLPSITFSDWFFQRELVLLYRFLLEALSQWCEQLVAYRDSQDVSVFERLAGDVLGSAAWYATGLGDGALTFYYEHDQPLDAFNGPRFPHVARRCREYHRYDATREHGAGLRFDYKIDAANPDYRQFLELQDHYHAFLVESFDPPGIRRMR